METKFLYNSLFISISKFCIFPESQALTQLLEYDLGLFIGFQFLFIYLFLNFELMLDIQKLHKKRSKQFP